MRIVEGVRDASGLELDEREAGDSFSYTRKAEL